MVVNESHGTLTRVDHLFERDPALADPALYWRQGFTLSAVAADYPYHRADVTSDLLNALREGDSLALVGGSGTGKSTLCKSVAHQWSRSGAGPVFAGSAPYSDDQLEDVAISQLTAFDGQPLVILENATIDQRQLAHDLLDEFGTAPDVSLLFEVHAEPEAPRSQTLYSNPDRSQPTLLERASVYHLPPLTKAEFEEAVHHFEAVTDQGVIESPGAVFDDFRREGIEGNELLHLAHRISIAGEAEESSLQQAVYEEFERISGYEQVVEDLALMVHVLNAADIPPYPEFLFAFDEPNEEVDAALDTLLDGTLVLRSAVPILSTNHRLWSSIYLQKFLEERTDPHRRFAAVVEAIFRTMDPEYRDELLTWIEDQSSLPLAPENDDGEKERELLRSSARKRETAVGSTAQVVDDIFSIGTQWPILAPLFGTSERAELDLSAHCSSVTFVKSIMKRGEMYFERGDYELAIDEYDHAQTVLEAADDVPEMLTERIQIEYFLNCGRVMDQQSNYNQAATFFSEARQAAIDIDDRVSRAESHMYLGGIADKTGDAVLATAHLRASRRLFQEVGESFRFGQVLRRLGLVLFRRGQFDEAEHLLRQAIDQFQRTGNQLEIAKCHNSLAILTERQGNYEEAKTNCKQGLSKSREIGYRKGVAKSNLNLGNIRRKENDLDGAAEAYERSLSSAQDLETRRGEAICLNNLGTIEMDRGNFDEAAIYYNQCLEVSRMIGNRRSEATALDNLGEVEQKRGNIDQAVEYHQESRQILEDIDYLPGLANCTRQLGLCALARDDLETADRYLTEALKLYRETGNSEMESEILEEIGEISEKRAIFTDR